MQIILYHIGGKKLKRKSFLSEKGFYIALAVSLIAVAVAAFIGVDQAVNQLRQNNQQIEEDIKSPNVIENHDEWVIPEQVLTPQDDIVDNRVEEQSPVVSEAPQVSTTITQEPSSTTSAKTELDYAKPLDGVIDVGYSGDDVIKSKTLDQWIMHTGIDILADLGTEIKAVNSGVVQRVEEDSMWGICVVIEHSNGIESHYYGLQQTPNLSIGQEINQGDLVGAVGETAEIESAQDTHLHFAMKQNGEWIDPLTLIVW